MKIKNKKRQCPRRENERFHFKKQCFTAMVLVSLILNTQTGTSLRRLEKKDTAIYKQTLNISKIRKDD